MNTITIAITDDDSLIVDLLSDFINSQKKTRVILKAGSADELLTGLQAADNLPDILILDLRMKDRDGVEVARTLKLSYPSIRIIVVSSYYQDTSFGFMMKAGVAAFLPKDLSPAHLLNVIYSVSEKGFYFTNEQITILRDQISAKVPQPVLSSENSLSERETEVLRLLCQQKTAREIGELLFITQRTVEGHKNNLFSKTGVKNIAGLVIYAVQRGIVRIEDLPLI